MRRVYFLAITTSVLVLGLACGEREEYKGSGSRSLVDPTFDGSTVSSSSSGDPDSAVLPDADASIPDAVPDTGLLDAPSDVKTDG